MTENEFSNLITNTFHNPITIDDDMEDSDQISRDEFRELYEIIINSNNNYEPTPMYVGTNGYEHLMRLQEQAEQEEERVSNELEREQQRLLQQQEEARQQRLAELRSENYMHHPLTGRVVSSGTKKVLFIGGPKDGSVQQIQQNHFEVSCYIQPDLPDVYQGSEDRREETLVIDEKGNKKWVTNWEQLEYKRPEEFTYRVLLVAIRQDKKFYAGVPAPLYKDIALRNRNSIDYILQKCNSTITVDYILSNTDVFLEEPMYRAYSDSRVNESEIRGMSSDFIISDEASFSDEVRGMWNSIMNSVSSDSNDNNNNNAD